MESFRLYKKPDLSIDKLVKTNYNEIQILRMSEVGERMLFMNRTLLKLARGLWGWILAIAAVNVLTLVGTTALAEIVAGFLGDLFKPQEMLATAWQAIGAALVVAVFTFFAQMLKGLLEYKTTAKAREQMRNTIFSKVMELDAGGIEKIGPRCGCRFR